MLLLLLGGATSFLPSSVPIPGCAAVHRRSAVTRAALDDCSDECMTDPDAEKPKFTVEGLVAFRERQRLRRDGKPLSVWSKSCDRPGYEPVADHVPVPPTAEQAAAADALFETRLREDVPEGFGEGLPGLRPGGLEDADYGI
tara:strand:- start:2016 stop:2441 length:426 start_codon:yes stop_codon:yes gene_type:complete